MRTARECGDLVLAVVEFCRQLRAWGIRLPSDASQTALAALREIDVTSRADFRTALRIVLVRRPEDSQRFTYLFNSFWGTGRAPAPDAVRAGEALASRPLDPRSLGRSPGDSATGDGDPPPGRSSTRRRTPDKAVGVEEIRSSTEGTSASPTEIVAAEGAVPALAVTEAAELDRLARGLAPVLATRRSRRWMRDARGPAIDLRGALRRSLRYGGAPLELPRRSRRRTRTRLVVFCDVSRSMDEHAAFFLRFAAAVLRRLWNVEVFLFATDTVRVTTLWLRESWATLKLRVPDCGGGTQIGACLARFLEDYESSLLGADTIVLVFSDGLDAGEPDVLEAALARIERRSRAIVWLNPLAHLDGYEPTARGMATALRHVDLFAAAHDVESLSSLVASLNALGGTALAVRRRQAGDRRRAPAPREAEAPA